MEQNGWNSACGGYVQDGFEFHVNSLYSLLETMDNY